MRAVLAALGFSNVTMALLLSCISMDWMDPQKACRRRTLLSISKFPTAKGVKTHHELVERFLGGARAEIAYENAAHDEVMV